jgi:hypothetical protein
MLQASSQYNVLVGAAVVATTDLIQEATWPGSRARHRRR